MRTLSVSSLVLLAMLLGGCANNDKIMASWMGHHYNDVIASWGPPSQIIDEPPGKIMTWAYGGTVYTPVGRNVIGQNYTKTRTFWTDAQGVIYRWAWRGQ
jgi:hypothetical protein